MCVTYAHTPSFIDVHGIPKGAGPRQKVNNTKQTWHSCLCLLHVGNMCETLSNKCKRNNCSWHLLSDNYMFSHNFTKKGNEYVFKSYVHDVHLHVSQKTRTLLDQYHRIPIHWNRMKRLRVQAPWQERLRIYMCFGFSADMTVNTIVSQLWGSPACGVCI